MYSIQEGSLRRESRTSLSLYPNHIKQGKILVGNRNERSVQWSKNSKWDPVSRQGKDRNKGKQKRVWILCFFLGFYVRFYFLCYFFWTLGFLNFVWIFVFFLFFSCFRCLFFVYFLCKHVSDSASTTSMNRDSLLLIIHYSYVLPI